jgi:hypothetical protein
MAETYKQLREMTKEQLIAKYDGVAHFDHLHYPPQVYLEEIARRDATEQTDAIHKMTKTMTRLTWVITGLTVINVAITAWLAFR